MKRIICASEIIGSFTRNQQEFEVCATTVADFDEVKSQLRLELDSFIRPIDLVAKEQRMHADWLPKNQNLVEAISRDEAFDLAKEVFHRWAGKVRRSLPSPVHNN